MMSSSRDKNFWVDFACGSVILKIGRTFWNYRDKEVRLPRVDQWPPRRIAQSTAVGWEKMENLKRPPLGGATVASKVGNISVFLLTLFFILFF